MADHHPADLFLIGELDKRVVEMTGWAIERDREIACLKSELRRWEEWQGESEEATRLNGAKEQMERQQSYAAACVYIAGLEHQLGHRVQEIEELRDAKSEDHAQ